MILFRVLATFFVTLTMIFSSARADVCALVADTKSGLVLAAKDADVPAHPASLTKVMTLYLTFWALEHKLLAMDDRLPISKTAASRPKSKLYLKAGGSMSVYEAIMALIIKSANDAAVVLAEALAPSESAFAEIMTETGRQLGLKHTVFKNASGLHHPDQVTCAQDMAVLTIALINHFPQYYPLFSTEFFEYNGRRYYSHNHILKEYDGAEGLKTGFISAAGYNIITTAKKDKTRLVTVVLGQKSTRARDDEAIRLLDEGFYKVLNKNTFFKRFERPGLPHPLERRALVPQPKLEERFAVFQEHLDAAKKQAREAFKNDRFVRQASSETPKWGIQVGAFNTKSLALENARRALSLLDEKKKEIATPRFETFFRSRIFGFQSSREASAACRRLKDNRIDCFMVGPVY